MSNSTDRARYEQKLATAHRFLYQAQEAAEQLRDEGAAEDLQQLLVEVTRLTQASLKGNLKRSVLDRNQLILC